MYSARRERFREWMKPFLKRFCFSQTTIASLPSNFLPNNISGLLFSSQYFNEPFWIMNFIKNIDWTLVATLLVVSIIGMAIYDLAFSDAVTKAKSKSEIE